MKTLKDYITEADSWSQSPASGDDFAINIREECLVETYVVESKNDSIMIQADDKLIAILESYGCQLEETNGWGAMEEEMSVDDVLVSEDPTQEEPASDQSAAVPDGTTADDPIGENYINRILELSGCGRKAMEGDISQIEKDIADAPVAPMGTIGEGAMSEIDIDLQSLANRGDEEDLIAALEGDLGPGTAIVLKNMMEELKDELASNGMNDVINDDDKMIEMLWDKIVDEYGGRDMNEAEYQGRKVPLGKPMRGDVAKFKVYVRDPKTGNIKKVNFGHGGKSAKRAGQKTMRIKKSDPARRRSFRARHRCDNPGPRTKARYWSCRMW